jgi:Trp operon repressor
MKSSRDDRLAQQQAILRFLDIYEQASTEERLWQLFRLTLSSEEGNDWNEKDRVNWFYFYELLRGLVRRNNRIVKGELGIGILMEKFDIAGFKERLSVHL